MPHRHHLARHLHGFPSHTHTEPATLCCGDGQEEEDGVSTVEDGGSTVEDGGSTMEDSACPTDEGVLSLEEARRLIRELRDRHRAQAHQLLFWKRRYKAQEEVVGRLVQERNEQLRALSSQLLLFEARLCRKQHNISVLLAQRDAVILRQQRTIRQLQSRLSDAGLDCADDLCGHGDSLNDSDSAVIMEDDDFRHGSAEGATVVRSVSDALDTPIACKYSSMRRNNGFLRRPEVLETVYSIEEDGDNDQPQSSNQVDSGIEEPNTCNWKSHKGRLKDVYGSFERLDQERQPEPQNHVTTYNRVMSNHRSVTKPKDVKYKRINKAKSKSLEELRGRLKNWVEKGNKIAISLDQSFN